MALDHAHHEKCPCSLGIAMGNMPKFQLSKVFSPLRGRKQLERSMGNGLKGLNKIHYSELLMIGRNMD